MTDQFTTKATYDQVFAVPQFRVIFAARLLGVMSDTLRAVALAVLVYRQTNSPLLTAMTINFLPQAAGGLFLAAMADRFSPRTLISTEYALQCAVGLVLAFAELPIAVSLVIVAAVTCLTPVTNASTARVTGSLTRPADSGVRTSRHRRQQWMSPRTGARSAMTTHNHHCLNRSESGTRLVPAPHTHRGIALSLRRTRRTRLDVAARRSERAHGGCPYRQS